MKTDCCGCGCTGCLFWLVIFGALVLGSCSAGRAQVVAGKLKSTVRPSHKVEQKYNISKPVNNTGYSHSR